MNKKQLIVAWIATILICITLLCFPKKHCSDTRLGKYYRDKPNSASIPVTQWGHVTPICITLLLIGGVLIYTLKDKKK